MNEDIFKHLNREQRMAVEPRLRDDVTKIRASLSV